MGVEDSEVTAVAVVGAVAATEGPELCWSFCWAAFFFKLSLKHFEHIPSWLAFPKKPHPWNIQGNLIIKTQHFKSWFDHWWITSFLYKAFTPGKWNKNITFGFPPSNLIIFKRYYSDLFPLILVSQGIFWGDQNHLSNYLCIDLSKAVSWPMSVAESRIYIVKGGRGGRWPWEGRNRVYCCSWVLTEGSVSYQKLFTRSKNIVPSRSYRIYKSWKYG